MAHAVIANGRCRALMAKRFRRAGVLAGAACLGLAIAGAPTLALALGPAAPFLPPRAASAPAPGAGEGGDRMAWLPGAPAAGLAGVRLGTRAMALIDGQWWPLGSRLRGGARLAAVQPRGVWLRHADGRGEFIALLASAAAAPAAAAAEARSTLPESDLAPAPTPTPTP